MLQHKPAFRDGSLALLTFPLRGLVLRHTSLLPREAGPTIVLQILLQLFNIPSQLSERVTLSRLGRATYVSLKQGWGNIPAAFEGHDGRMDVGNRDPRSNPSSYPEQIAGVRREKSCCLSFEWITSRVSRRKYPLPMGKAAAPANGFPALDTQWRVLNGAHRPLRIPNPNQRGRDSERPVRRQPSDPHIPGKPASSKAPRSRQMPRRAGFL